MEAGSGTTRRSEKFTLQDVLRLAAELEEADGGFSQSGSLGPYFEDVKEMQAVLGMMLGSDAAAATCNGILYGLKLAEQRFAPLVAE